MLGEVAEWSNAPDSKSGIRLYRIVGSNPTLSAKHTIRPLNLKGLFVLCVSDLQNDYQGGVIKNLSMVRRMKRSPSCRNGRSAGMD